MSTFGWICLIGFGLAIAAGGVATLIVMSHGGES